jgi:hypothetical protein
MRKEKCYLECIGFICETVMAKRNYKREYKKWHSSPKARAKRAELNRIARKRGIYGKRRSMGKDLSHTKDGRVVLEKSSTNRARNGVRK